MRITIHNHLSATEIRQQMRSQKEVLRFKKWQIINAVLSNPDKLVADIAAILSIDTSEVYRTVECYNKHGKPWLDAPSAGGRREARCLLSLADEQALMSSIESEALSGKILIFKHIKLRVEESVGHTVSEDYIWDLFKRHGWRKKRPRPRHPKAEVEKQEAYKKNSAKSWQPSRWSSARSTTSAP
jgi:transposase